MKIKIKLSAKADYIPDSIIGTIQEVTEDHGTHWRFEAEYPPGKGEIMKWFVRKENAEVIENGKI